MTNLMHGTMMTQRKVMVGAKSGLHFKSMPKYYLQKIRFTRESIHNKTTFCIQRHGAPVEYTVPEDHEIKHTSSATWKKLLQIITTHPFSISV